MKRILIVTDSFTPDFAPRVSFLAKNLTRRGHSVTVLTEDIETPFFRIDVGDVEVDRPCFYKSKPHIFLRQVEWAFKALLNLVFDYKSYFFSKKWSGVASGYDVVLCSTFNYFPLKPAYNLAKRLGVPFVADVRDLAEQFTCREYQQHNIPLFGALLESVQKCRRNRYLRRADALISVSPWHKEFLRKYNSNVHLIYNGYDGMFSFSEFKSDTFDILYTGKWLGCDMQDPRPLFSALEEIIVSGSIPSEKIRLVWYLSRGKDDMKSLLAAYPACQKISVFEPAVQYKEIPSIICNSSVVLVLSNKLSEKGPKGIITTKFFEALGCEKPVLNVISDDSYLSALIKETSAGLTADSAPDVKRFILEKYNEWSSNGFTHQNVNLTAKGKYDRAYQATQFEAVFESLKSAKK